MGRVYGNDGIPVDSTGDDKSIFLDGNESTLSKFQNL